MKFDDCAKRLADSGYELLGSSSEGVTMTNGIVKVTFYNTKTSYGNGTDLVQRMYTCYGNGTDLVQRMYTYMGLSGEWDDYLAQDEDNALIPGCPQVSVEDQVDILTGSPTEIVRKFREMKILKDLDVLEG